jgi:hypothetical protein
MACTIWKDFALAPNARHRNAQGLVKNAFWVTLYIIHVISFVCIAYKFFTDKIQFDIVKMFHCGSC